MVSEFVRQEGTVRPSPLDNLDSFGRIPPIIGLMGAAGAGKSSVASHLIETQQAVRNSFANALRHATADVFRLPPHSMYAVDQKDVVLPQWGLTPRQILQKFGSAVRAIHPDVWVHALAVQLLDVPKGYTAIIDDVRYENEIDFINQYGGVVVEIHRPGVKYAEDHPSARDLSCYADVVVYNDSSVEEAAEAVWEYRPFPPDESSIDEAVPYIPMHNESGSLAGSRRFA